MYKASNIVHSIIRAIDNCFYDKAASIIDANWRNIKDKQIDKILDECCNRNAPPVIGAIKKRWPHVISEKDGGAYEMHMVRWACHSEVERDYELIELYNSVDPNVIQRFLNRYGIPVSGRSTMSNRCHRAISTHFQSMLNLEDGTDSSNTDAE